MIEDHINHLEFYNNLSFSIEDKITNLLGEVYFYNKEKRDSNIGKNKKISLKDKIVLPIRFVNPKNKIQVNKCAQALIEYAERLGHRPLPAILYRTHID